MNAVIIKSVTKYRQSKKVLDQISFSLSPGERMVLLGPSGSGKTTLLRLLAGLEQPDEGEIFLKNKLVSSNKYIFPSHKRKIAFAFQEPVLWPHMSVYENIAFAIKAKKKKETRVEELLNKCDLSGFSERVPRELSGGEARRVSICRALAAEADYLLLDEPLANLNRALKEKVLQLILEEIKRNKTTLIYVTHDETMLKLITDNIYYLKNGKISSFYE